MTTTDWIVDIALVLIVIRQMREERLNARFVILPLAIVGFVAHKYLHGLPTDGNDLVLVLVFLGAGVLLGLAGGLLTKVRVVDGHAHVKAGPAAAGLWIASMGARLGFIVWISHSAGQAALAHFSAEHHITSGTAWETALVLLALSEVVVRVATIVVRAYVKTSARGGDNERGDKLVLAA